MAGGSPTGAVRPWLPTPGPVDHVSFFEAQRRNRRATRRLTALCTLVVAAMGAFTSIPVTLMLIGAGILGVSGLENAGLIQAGSGVATLLHGLARLARPLFDGGAVGSQALGALVLILPGLVTLLLVWRLVRALLTRAGVGGVLLHLGAREPRGGDLEEQQLVNVVAEMAIAAGVQPPRVVLLDSEAANAAAIGSSVLDATVVVSRRLVDEFDRDETQGALAYLIGMIGNGDLGVALTVVSVFRTFDLLFAVLFAPVSRHARQALWRVVRVLIRPWSAGGSADELDAVATMLSGVRQSSGMDDLNHVLERLTSARLWALLPLAFFLGIGALLVGAISSHAFGVIARIIFVPVYIAAGLLAFSMVLLFVFMVTSLVQLFMLGPMIALTWRTRCYLADASAVQFTRNPDGLAAALVALAQRGGVIAGSQSVDHLFIVGPEAAGRRAIRLSPQMQEEMRRQLQGLSPAERVQWMRAHRPLMLQMAHAASAAQPAQAATKGTFEDANNVVISFHPSLRRRLKRLATLGATVAQP